MAVPDQIPERVTSATLWALLAAFLTQSAAAFGFIGFTLLAPGLADETGLDERDFGLAFSFIFLGTSIASPFCGAMMRRLGSVTAMMLCLIGMGLSAMITLAGTWSAVMFAAFAYGVFYGPYGPANVTMVSAKTPRRRVGLFMAIRQSGVSLAGMTAGYLLPAAMLTVGWQAGVYTMVIVVAVAALATVLFAPVFRIRPDDRPAPSGRPFGLRRMAERFMLPPHLRLLGWTAIAFAVSHTSLFTFTYIYLLEGVGLGPVEAGVFFAIVQLTAIAGLPLAGFFSDMIDSPETTLAILAVGASCAIGGALTLTPETPVWIMYAIAILAGLSGNSWSPIFMTAVSLRAPAGQVGEMNGRAYAFASLGWMTAPPLIWGLIELSGDYTVPFGVVIAGNLIGGSFLLAQVRKARLRPSDVAS
ncbi:MAG: MFS transporter [Minwuia sp.]|uniref:MFS transporter n=1 Tax=Minwuia sp. TaxID=2493630 RepID=UPI003A8A8EC8